VKNDVLTVCVCVIHYSPLVRCFLIRLTLTMFLENIGMKLQDDTMSQ